MAKAFIGEAQMPYMIISGGEVKSATDIKRIFSVARLKKSCIIFFDEFDTKMIMEKKFVLSLILK